MLLKSQRVCQVCCCVVGRVLPIIAVNNKHTAKLHHVGFLYIYIILPSVLKEQLQGLEVS
jgi:hypothetical protein